MRVRRNDVLSCDDPVTSVGNGPAPSLIVYNMLVVNIREKMQREVN